jgi:hypothetical protein
MTDKPTSFPTYGYKPDGSAQIFDLTEEDGELPEGWSRQQEPRHHPNLANTHPVEPVPPEPPPESEEVEYDLATDEIKPKKRGRHPKSEYGGNPRPPEGD